MGALLVAICFAGCIAITGLVFGATAIANRIKNQKDQKLSQLKGTEPSPLSYNRAHKNGKS